MKKKLIVLMTATLFSLGAAIYANKSNLNVINETNVEALAQDPEQQNGGGGVSPIITISGTAGNRILFDNVTHMATWEGKTKAYDDDGDEVNDCDAKSGSTCTISMTTPIYNITEFGKMLEEFFANKENVAELVEWVLAKFAK